MFHKKEYNKNIKLFDNKTKYFYGNKQKRECFHSLFCYKYGISTTFFSYFFEILISST